MRIIGNLLWWLFWGLEAAIGYFTGSLAMACTIIGIPVALQTFKIGLLCLGNDIPVYPAIKSI